MNRTYESEIEVDLLECRSAILKWYGHVKRDLPWRMAPSPYKTWISEIMLQQTQVETVIGYFNRFTEVIPDVFTLAEVDDDRLMKLWEGLGYYSRARNLKKCAMKIVAEHGGEFPREVDALMKLPGIGPYTAGAIASIAFGLPEPAVDGNVMRVSARLFDLSDDIADPRTRRIIEDRIRPLYMGDGEYEPASLTQSLMELGALVCTPKNPKCLECPLVDNCLSRRRGTISERPIKTKKKKQTVHTMAVARVIYDGTILVSKRSEGLLTGLWGLPIGEGEDGEKAFADLLDNLETVYACGPEKFLTAPVFRHEARHVFTHRIWQMQVYDIELRDLLVMDYPEISWMDPKGDDIHALPTAFKKAINF